MSQQNFVEQFRLFMEYARKNSMHSRECMLWVSLFYLANEEATYNAETQTYEWPDGFFEVSNGELNSYGRFDKQAVESLRNRLRQRGLIEFLKGNRNSASPMYKINYLIRFGNKIIPNTQAREYAKEYANPHPNNMPNNMPNDMPTHPPLYINIKQGEYENTDQDDEDEPEYTRARREVERSWQYCFGRNAAPIIMEELARRAVALEFAPGILKAAIKIAAMKEAESPVDYVMTLLADWHNNGVRTVDDADRYAALYDMNSGKYGEYAAMKAPELIDEFRARNMAKG